MRAPLPAAAALAAALALSGGALASDPPGRPLPPEPKPSPEITADEIRHSVAWLADDARDGRDTDTDGCREAARWVAARMKSMGLEPLPEAPEYLLPWTLPGGTPEPEGCSLELVRGDQATSYAWGKDFVAMSGSAAGSVDAPAAFAGYGIAAPDMEYADYVANDAKGRVAFIFRHEPREKDPKSRWNGDRMTQHSWFARKVGVAAQAGVAALVIVNDPLNHERDDIDAGSAELGVQAPIPVLFASAAVAADVLRGTGMTPKELQQKIDDADAPVAVSIEGLRVRVKTSVRKASSENVVGMLRGSDPALRDQWVVVGAHYDHVGRGRSGGLDPKLHGQIHNGADDNASGTAALLEVAGWFAGRPERSRRSILFAAYSGEERGLLGSQALVASDLPPKASVAAMVNLDMVGRYRPGQFEVVGAATGSTLRETVDKAAEGLGLEYRHTNSGLGSSDGYSYYQAGIPTVFFFTGLHDDYHRPADDWWLVDAAGTAKVAEFAARTTRLLADADVRPVHAKVPQQEIPIGRSGRVILGVLLDEAVVDGQGAKVLSLSRRSVAAKAGIKEGDRIVSLGGQEVKDPESLRAALARVRPGESVPVKVRRGEQALEMKVDFPAPPGPVFGVAWDDGATGGKGALVREVAAGSVAEKAGVKPGDRILSFGGKDVPDAASLPAVLRTATAGAKLKVKVLRDGKEVELEAAFP